MSAKYGILFYPGTSNIGDDIQTFAAKRFLPKIDYVINREELDTFVSNHREKVNVIMNGWFFHKAENWPPSIFIHPKLISMHFTKNMMVDGWTSKYPNVLDGYSKNFFLDHAPVGCRDQHTMSVLKELHVDHYFSSCLTTTIVLDTKKKVEDVIYAVDISEELCRFIEMKTKYRVIPITHVMTPADQDQSFDVRMQKVEQLLTKYQNARLVVTSRLHAALPCLALKTPVLLIRHEDDLYSGRLETFYEFLNTSSEKALLEGTDVYDFDQPLKNPSDYLKYRKQLISDCESFIETTREKQEKVSEKEYVAWLENVKAMQKENLKNIIIRNFNELHGLTKEKERLSRENDALKRELEKIYYSRSYKMTQAVKKLLGKK